MKNIVLGVVLLLAVVSTSFGVGFLRVSQEAALLAQQVDQLEAENGVLLAERNGLREANADLLQHLEQTRQLAARLPEPMVEPLSMRFAELPPALEDELYFEVAEASSPERELTPEEQADREARLAEREARRAEWEARREEMRERVVTEVQDRRAFFEQVSLEGLAPEYVAGHQRLLEAMDEVQVRIAALSDPELTPEEQRNMRREIGQLGRELNGLMGMQREILLNDYAQAMGFQGADARVFIDSIETINEMTNVRGVIWGGGRGRGR